MKPRPISFTNPLAAAQRNEQYVTFSLSGTPLKADTFASFGQRSKLGQEVFWNVRCALASTSTIFMTYVFLCSLVVTIQAQQTPQGTLFTVPTIATNVTTLPQTQSSVVVTLLNTLDPLGTQAFAGSTTAVAQSFSLLQLLGSLLGGLLGGGSGSTTTVLTQLMTFNLSSANIPQNASILNASLTFSSASWDGLDLPLAMDMLFDNSLTNSPSVPYSSRSFSSTITTWPLPTTTWNNASRLTSPTITSNIQNIVSRVDYNVGSSVSLILSPNAQLSSSTTWRSIYALVTKELSPFLTVTFLDVCAPNPCQNGGVCVRLLSPLVTFLCLCPLNFGDLVCGTNLLLHPPCGPVLDFGLQWPSTLQSDSSVLHCPGGSTGIAKRVCCGPSTQGMMDLAGRMCFAHLYGQWMATDFSNCSSPTIRAATNATLSALAQGYLTPSLMLTLTSTLARAASTASGTLGVSDVVNMQAALNALMLAANSTNISSQLEAHIGSSINGVFASLGGLLLTTSVRAATLPLFLSFLPVNSLPPQLSSLLSWPSLFEHLSEFYTRSSIIQFDSIQQTGVTSSDTAWSTQLFTMPNCCVNGASIAYSGLWLMQGFAWNSSICTNTSIPSRTSSVVGNTTTVNSSTASGESNQPLVSAYMPAGNFPPGCNPCSVSASLYTTSDMFVPPVPSASPVLSMQLSGYSGGNLASNFSVQLPITCSLSCQKYFRSSLQNSSLPGTGGYMDEITVSHSSVDGLTIHWSLWAPGQQSVFLGTAFISGTATCVWWNYQKGNWSTEGCYLESISVSSGSHNDTGLPTATARCVCSHLTNFAVLVSVGGSSNTGSGSASLFSSGGGASGLALTWITVIGCCVSTSCMVILILTFFILHRQLFNTVHHYILVHLCFALIMYVYTVNKYF